MRVDPGMHAPRALAAAQAQAHQAKRADDQDEQSGKRVVAKNVNQAEQPEQATMFLAQDHFFIAPVVAPRVSAAKSARDLHALDQARSSIVAGVVDAVTPAFEQCVKFAERCKRNAVLFFKSPKWYVQNLVSTGQISESAIASRLAAFAKYEENDKTNV